MASEGSIDTPANPQTMVSRLIKMNSEIMESDRSNATIENTKKP